MSSIDPRSASWDTDLLRSVALIAPDAWLTGGSHTYRPFFENRFGPPTDSWDVDIRVCGEGRAFELQKKLETIHPEGRWHVKDALSWSRKEIGQTASTVEETFGANALICICLGVRWNCNRVELYWGHPEAETDLRNGVLRPNPHGQVAFAKAKANKIAQYYPGVSAPFIGHERAAIQLSYLDAIQQSRSHERGGLKKLGGLSSWELSVANEIARLREPLNRCPLPVPWPAAATIPTSDPWLSKDKQFRIWIVNQVRSRMPVGGRDEYLEHALGIQTGVVQKPTHQGWDLRLHVLHAILELQTDHLPDYRRPLRVAMLWHDIGKLWNVNTPGAHAIIGAKKWMTMQRTGLHGVNEEKISLITRFISIHDFLGRLERGLWDESYQGALSPTSIRSALESSKMPVRTMIEITKALWLADVGSIPLLRWLKPLANLLEVLVTGVD